MFAPWTQGSAARGLPPPSSTLRTIALQIHNNVCAGTCSCKIARLISFAGHALTSSTFFSVKHNNEIRGLQVIMKVKSHNISRYLLRAGAALAIATALSACASKPGPWPSRAQPANAAVTVDATQFLSRIAPA